MAEIMTEQAYIDVQGRAIIVKTPYNLLPLHKILGTGRWDDKEKQWRYPLSFLDATQIDERFGSLVARSKAFTEYLLKGDQEIDPSVQLFPDVIDQPEIRKADLWLHQLKGYWFANQVNDALLAMDMGTGKTLTSISLIQNQADAVRNVLVLCPLKVVNVWPKELEKWCKIPYTVQVFDKHPVAARALAISRFMARPADGTRIVVVNYDPVRNTRMLNELMKHEWDLLICDESHKLKSPGGVTSKNVAKLAARAKRRLLLTGTPMPHSPLDIYAQFRIINPDIFGTSFVRFRNRYAKLGGFENRQVIGYQNMDDFNRRLFSHTYKVGKEVLDLPPYHHVTHECELSEKAASIYKEMRDELIVELEERPDDPIVAQNVLVKMLRLQQVTGGHIDGTTIDDSKALLLTELLDDLDPNEPVVIFGQFTPDLSLIRKACIRLNRGCLELSGRVNELDAWQRGYSPASTILAVQMQAGGVGIDLTRAAYCIYYSTGFNLGDYEQSLSRVHRPGQTRTTTYLHLHATLPPNGRRTIDQTISRALSMRKKIVDAVMNGEILASLICD